MREYEVKMSVIRTSDGVELCSHSAKLPIDQDEVLRSVRRLGELFGDLDPNVERSVKASKILNVTECVLHQLGLRSRLAIADVLS